MINSFSFQSINKIPKINVGISGWNRNISVEKTPSLQDYPFTLIGNGLQAFYRPDASAVTLISGAVRSLTDLSENGHTMTQNDPTKRPIWNASGINGQPTMDFDGTDDGLECATNVQVTKHPWTQMAVIQPRATTGQRCVFIGTNGNGGHALTIGTDTAGTRGIRSSGAATAVDDNVTTNPEVWIAQGTENTATLTNFALWTGTSFTPQTLVPSNLVSSAFSGNGSSLGCLTISFFFFFGKIAEYLFVDRALSTLEMMKYLTYVTSRYGAI